MSCSCGETAAVPLPVADRTTAPPCGLVMRCMEGAEFLHQLLRDVIFNVGICFMTLY